MPGAILSCATGPIGPREEVSPGATAWVVVRLHRRGIHSARDQECVARQEAPIGGEISRNSEFSLTFAARGPRDKKGRSLRDLDLQNRLQRYPCSYMIYSDAFEALPSQVKDAIYKRMWQVLSGRAQEKQYVRLTVSDRQSIVEILRDTKKGLPDYFQPLK